MATLMRLYPLLRPLAFLADAEKAHRATIAALKMVPKRLPPPFPTSLRTSLAGLDFRSPVGLAAFLLDPGPPSLELIGRTFGGRTADLTRDDALDIVTLFWLTNTAVSAARLYRENKLPYFVSKSVTIPAAVSVFPDEFYQAPRSWAERAYPKLIHYRKVSAGGHFAAWEQPQLFSEEVRAGFRSLRG